MTSFSKKNVWMFDIFFLLFFLISIFFIMLGTRPLSIPDEANYAEIAREMFHSKDYFTPYLNGIKFFEKPVLLYWFGVGIAKIFGLHLWSLRSVNAILAIFGCLITYFTAKKIYDHKTGIIAACILGTSMLYFILAHMYTMDLSISVLIAMTLYAFIIGVKEPSHRFFYFIMASIAAGLAVLMKGLMGIVLPFLIIGVWIALFREWKLIRLKEIVIYFAIVMAIALPWHIIVTLYHPEFLHFYFVEHHLSRFSSGDIGHLRPFWYYIPVVIMGFFPWIIFLPQALIKTFSKGKKIEIFFSCYAIIIFLFFSISKAKLIPYVLPMFPPLAILIAHYVKNSLTLKRHYIFLCILSGIVALSCVLFTKFWQVADPELTSFYLNIAAGILITGSFIGYFFSDKKPLFAIYSTILMGAIIGILLIIMLPAMDRLTIYPLTQILKPILQNEDEVIAFNHHYQDLSFYLERRVNILNSRKLFSFGMQHQKNHAWMMDDRDLDLLWQSQQRVFAIMDIEQYQKIPEKYRHLVFHLWGQTSKNVLVSNMPLDS